MCMYLPSRKSNCISNATAGSRICRLVEAFLPETAARELKDQMMVWRGKAEEQAVGCWAAGVTQPQNYTIQPTSQPKPAHRNTAAKNECYSMIPAQVNAPKCPPPGTSISTRSALDGDAVARGEAWRRWRWTATGRCEEPSRGVCNLVSMIAGTGLCCVVLISICNFSVVNKLWREDEI